MTDQHSAHTFEVWAPHASSVALCLHPGWGSASAAATAQGADGSGASRPAGTYLEMTGDGTGWWRVTAPCPGTTDYMFWLNDAVLRPDPRSRWQPFGVHGPSRLWSPQAHQWADDDFDGKPVAGSVIYELHVGTFTPEGTFDSAISMLPDLARLGIDMIELMPVAAFDGRHGWGYDGVCWYAVHHDYGGPAAMQRFVDSAHQHGMGVCLDVVYNHLGPSGNYLNDFGPYFTAEHSTPWGEAINLSSTGSAQVRDHILGSIRHWFTDFHLDALRLDAVHELHDPSDRHILHDISSTTAELSDDCGKPLGLIAESDKNDPATIEPLADGGLGMTAQWADDVHHAIHVACSGETHGYYEDFAEETALGKVMSAVFFHDGTWSSFRNTTWGKPVDPARHSGHSFVAFSQNHDQIGNRAAGDRPADNTSVGNVAARAALTILSPFTVMLFMGEEYGTTTPFQYFTSFPDPQLQAAVRDGRRAEFARHGWSATDVADPTATAAISHSTLTLPRQLAAHSASVATIPRQDAPASLPHNSAAPTHAPAAAMFSWYQRLIQLKNTVPDIATGELTHTAAGWWPGARVCWLRRGNTVVLCNLTDEPLTLGATPDAGHPAADQPASAAGQPPDNSASPPLADLLTAGPGNVLAQWPPAAPTVATSTETGAAGTRLLADLTVPADGVIVWSLATNSR